MEFDPRRLPQDREIVLEEEWDAETYDLNAPSWRFKGAVRVAARVRRDNAVVQVGIDVTGALAAVCGRCDQAFDAAFRRTAAFVYPVEDGARTVVLDEDIRAEILLSFPQRILCADTCKGLCARCGADLNKEICKCT